MSTGSDDRQWLRRRSVYSGVGARPALQRQLSSSPVGAVIDGPLMDVARMAIAERLVWTETGRQPPLESMTAYRCRRPSPRAAEPRRSA